MMEDTLQTTGDRLHQLTHIKNRGHRIIYFQKQPELIPLLHQFLSGRLCTLIIERIIYSNRDLVSHLLQKEEVAFAIGMFLYTAKHQSTQPSEAGCQWQCTKGLHTILPEYLDQCRETSLLINVRNNHRLLCPPRPASR